MSWTDERVEKLQEMWAEGLSAAQIARTLGGVTRNAVIGKVHRMGLSNRAAPGKPEAEEAGPEEETAMEIERPPAPEAAPAPESAPEEVETAAAAATAPAARPPTRDPLRREPAPLSDDRREALATLAEIEKTARRVTLLELTERVCKWPIGDPTDADFRFCGLPAVPGKPYCSAHVAVAFQPMSSRRDRDRQRIRG